MEICIVVHALLYDDKGRILIIKRALHEKTFPGLWDVPGGTLEDGEDPLEGIRREIVEEAGLEVEKLSLFCHTSNIDNERGKHFIRMIFIGRSGDLHIMLNSDDHSDYKWISPREPIHEELVDYLDETFRLLNGKEHELLEYTK